MFRIHNIPGFTDILLLNTCGSFFNRSPMQAYFLLVDNTFIDTGNLNDDISEFRSFVGGLDTEREWQIVNTHLHEDHCGNNAMVQRILDAKIMAPEKVEDFSHISFLMHLYWGRPEPFKYELFSSDIVKTDRGRTIRIIPAPGHTPDHVCCYIEDDDILFTGDAVPLPSRKQYTMPEEDYRQMIHTMKQILDFISPSTTVITAHNNILEDPRSYIMKRIENMERVVRDVEAVWGDSRQDYSAVAEEIFGREALLYRIWGHRVRADQATTIRSIIHPAHALS